MAKRDQLILQYIIQAQNQAQAAFAANNAQLVAMQKSMAAIQQQALATANAMNVLATSQKNVGGSVAGGVVAGELMADALRGIKDGFTDSVRAASQFNNTFIGLGTIARAFGQDIDATNAAAKDLASDGLMRVDEAALGLKNLLSAGFGLPEAIELMKGFKDIAAFNRQASLDFGYAITSATEGIKNQNSILVDNAGLTKNLTIILKEQGLSVQDLARVSQDAAVRQKLLQGLLIETGRSSGDAAKYANTYSGELSRMKTEFELLKVEIGNQFLPTLKDANGIIATFTHQLRENPEIIKGTTGAIGSLISIVGGMLIFNKVSGWVASAGASLLKFRGLTFTLSGAFTSVGTAVASLGTILATAAASVASFFVGWNVGKILVALDELADKSQSTFGKVFNYLNPAKYLGPAFEFVAGIGVSIERFFADREQETLRLSQASKIAGRDIKTLAEADQVIKNSGDALIKLQQASLDANKALAESRAKLNPLAEASKIAGRNIKDLAEADKIIQQAMRDSNTLRAISNAQLAEQNRLHKEALALARSLPEGLPPLPPAPVFKRPDIKPVPTPNIYFEPNALDGLTKENIDAARKYAEERADISKAMVKQIITALDSGRKNAKDISEDFKKDFNFNISPETITRIKEENDKAIKEAEKARAKLTEYNKSLQEFNSEFQAALKAGFNNDEIKEMFASRAADLVTQGRILKEIYGSAVKDVGDKIRELAASIKEAEIKQKVDELKTALSGVPSLTEDFGKGLEYLKRALAEGADFSDEWIKSNFDIIKALAAADPSLDRLITRYYELERAERKAADAADFFADQVKLSEEFIKKINDIDLTTNMSDELVTVSRASIEQQIRDTIAGTNKKIGEAKREFNQLKKLYDQGTIQYQAANAKRLGIAKAHSDRIVDLLEVQSDIEVGEALDVSERITRIWKEQANQIEAAWDAAFADGIISQEEIENIELMTTALDDLRNQILATAEAQAKFVEESDYWLDLGDKIGSAFRDAGLDKIGAAIDDIADSMRNVRNASKDMITAATSIKVEGFNAENFTDLAGGIAQASGAMLQATSSASKLQNILGGALSGAMFGANPAFVAATGGASVIAGAIGGAVLGWMRSSEPEWKRISENIGTMFGTEISQALAETIQATAERLDVSTRIAGYLELGSIVEESGGMLANFTALTKKGLELINITDQLFVGGNFGAAAEGIEEIDNLWSQMIDTMDRSMHDVVNPQMLAFIQHTRNAGFEIKGLSNFLEEMADTSFKGVSAVVEGFVGQINLSATTVENTTDRIFEMAERKASIITKLNQLAPESREYRTLTRELEALEREFANIVSTAQQSAAGLESSLGDPQAVEDRVARMGRLLNVTFEAGLASGKSFLESITGISPALDEITEAQEQFGFETSQTVNRLLELNDWAISHAPLAQSIEGLNDLMRGLANQGALTQSVFADLGTEASAQFADLQTSGLNFEDSLTLMQPSLQRIWELQKRFGYEVDATTQALLDQATATGRVGEQQQSIYDRLNNSIEDLTAAINLMNSSIDGTAGSLTDLARTPTPNATYTGDVARFRDENAEGFRVGDSGYTSRVVNDTRAVAEAQAEQQRVVAALDTSYQGLNTSLGQYATYQADLTAPFTDLTQHTRITSEGFARLNTSAVADLTSIYDAVNRVTYGNSPTGLVALIDYLNRTNAAFAESGGEGASAMDTISAALQNVNAEIKDVSGFDIEVSSLEQAVNLIQNLGNEGVTVTNALRGLSVEAGRQFSALLASGATVEDALNTMRPSFERIGELQQYFGREVIASTQALFNQAQAASRVGQQYESVYGDVNSKITEIPGSIAEINNALARASNITFDSEITSSQALIDILKGIAPTLYGATAAQQELGSETLNTLQRVAGLGQFDIPRAPVASITALVEDLGEQGLLTTDILRSLGVETRATFTDSEDDAVSTLSKISDALQGVATDVQNIPKLNITGEVEQKVAVNISDAQKTLRDLQREATDTGGMFTALAAGAAKVVGGAQVERSQQFQQAQQQLQQEVKASTQALSEQANVANQAGAQQQAVYDQLTVSINRLTSAIDTMNVALAHTELNNLGGIGTTRIDKVVGSLNPRPLIASNQQLDAMNTQVSHLTGSWKEMNQALAEAATRTMSVPQRVNPAIQDLQNHLRETETTFAAVGTIGVANMDSIYHAVNRVTYGNSPTGVTDLIDHLNEAIDVFNTAGDEGTAALDSISRSLQELNDNLTEVQLEGFDLQIFQLDRERRSEIQQWLDASKGEAQSIIDSGLNLIDQTFSIRLQQLQQEQSKTLQHIMFDINNELLSLTLNQSEAALHALQVEQFEMIERFLEETKGASQSFIDDGLSKIEQIFQLRAKKLREEARGTQEVAQAMRPVITALGDGIFRIQGADVVFGDMLNMFDSATASAARWAEGTTASAGVVLDSINAVSWGNSPGGIEQIAVENKKALASAYRMSSAYQAEMERVKDSVNEVGYSIDDQLTGTRNLNVQVDTAITNALSNWVPDIPEVLTASLDVDTSMQDVLSDVSADFAQSAQSLIAALSNAAGEITLRLPDEIPTLEVAIPDIDIPTVDINIPNIEIPAIDVRMPDIEIPTIDVRIPDIEVPTVDVRIPDIEIPTVDVNVAVPDVASQVLEQFNTVNNEIVSGNNDRIVADNKLLMNNLYGVTDAYLTEMDRVQNMVNTVGRSIDEQLSGDRQLSVEVDALVNNAMGGFTTPEMPEAKTSLVIDNAFYDAFDYLSTVLNKSAQSLAETFDNASVAVTPPEVASSLDVSIPDVAQNLIKQFANVNYEEIVNRNQGIATENNNMMRGMREVSDAYMQEMDKVKVAVNDVGYSIDEQLTRDRALNVDVRSKMGTLERPETYTPPVLPANTTSQGNVDRSITVVFEDGAFQLMDGRQLNPSLVENMLTQFTQRIQSDDREGVRFAKTVVARRR